MGKLEKVSEVALKHTAAEAKRTIHGSVVRVEKSKGYMCKESTWLISGIWGEATNAAAVETERNGRAAASLLGLWLPPAPRNHQ